MSSDLIFHFSLRCCSFHAKLLAMRTIYPILCLFWLITPMDAQTAPDEKPFEVSRPLYVGARALAMGNAFTAVADDATAGFWNPAGLIQCQGVQ
ncbi:MAG: hypothetical protein OXI24_07065, partial [Candidatus Poribacteria bacterium]|nr:hypothetical protein [Candidatus Poribacteria bacterium]